MSSNWLADVRDIFIIFLALESIIVVGLLVWLIWEIRGLTVLLKHEIKPILESAQDTLSTVRGTTTFISENVVSPFVKLHGYIAGARATLENLMGTKRKK
jgi:hypothetical protein